MGFQEQSGGSKKIASPKLSPAEQLGISGTVRRFHPAEAHRRPGRRTAWDFRNSQAEVWELEDANLSGGRTAWDFRNSQAGTRPAEVSTIVSPNSLGFQEQSGGGLNAIIEASKQPNSLGFQEQSGGRILNEGLVLTEAEQLGISGTVRRLRLSSFSLILSRRTAWDFRNSQAGKQTCKRKCWSARRTAWDFRNSQAGDPAGITRLSLQPNSLGFQEQSGGNNSHFCNLLF